MIYKQQMKQEESLTQLRLLRLAHTKGVTYQQAALVFSCHRNTVSSLCASFHTRLSDMVQHQLLTDTTLSLVQINHLLAPLKHTSSQPYHHPKQPTPEQQYAVVFLFMEEKWRCGYRTMETRLERTFHDYQSEDALLFSLSLLTVRQIRSIYERFDLRFTRIRTCVGTRKPLYDYETLGAFEYLHFDTKVLADQKSLPPQVYDMLQSSPDVPVYQWTLIDAKTRIRFLAYSYGINAEFGLKFLLLVICFIRVTFRLWTTHISIGQDNGSELCSGSERKCEEWNSILSLLNASVYQYIPRFDIRKNLVERSHRTDDDLFLIPRGELCTDKEAFFLEARRFYDYYTFERAHQGRCMHKRTPYEVLVDTGVMNPQGLLTFPLLLLEDALPAIRKTVDLFLFRARLIQQEEEQHQPLSAKQIIDLSRPFDFFHKDAQKVLTHYHMSNFPLQTMVMS